MQMMQCPHCRALNSVKRERCYQCRADLRAAPKAAEEPQGPTCATCSRAAIFPPPGQRLSTDQVWCTMKCQALASVKVAESCFSAAFVWNRTDVLG